VAEPGLKAHLKGKHVENEMFIPFQKRGDSKKIGRRMGRYWNESVEGVLREEGTGDEEKKASRGRHPEERRRDKHARRTREKGGERGSRKNFCREQTGRLNGKGIGQSGLENKREATKEEKKVSMKRT